MKSYRDSALYLLDKYSYSQTGRNTNTDRALVFAMLDVADAIRSLSAPDTSTRTEVPSEPTKHSEEHTEPAESTVVCDGLGYEVESDKWPQYEPPRDGVTIPLRLLGRSDWLETSTEGGVIS